MITLSGPVIGFDFGTTRIGIAAGQAITGTATPLAPISARDGIPDWHVIEVLITEWQAAAIVVGIPLNMDGSISDMSRRARKFANRLKERCQLPCYLIDERLTTREAKQISLSRGGSSNFKENSVDGIAAQLILESWFESDQLISSETRLEDLYGIGRN
ncbi:Holliday junction resolvase RuvX [Amphritea sp.]|uniref:Holliday junction resolvase RuvX n=1 Tax=Amphritea sp. TaxID=1872502 RepID=UPI003A924360